MSGKITADWNVVGVPPACVLTYSLARLPPNLSALVAVPWNLAPDVVTPAAAFFVSTKLIPWLILSNPVIVLELPNVNAVAFSLIIATTTSSIVAAITP